MGLFLFYSVVELGAKHSGYEIGWLGYNISTQARSRYSSLAAVLGSKIPRRVPAVLKYLLMIDVISLQPMFTVMRFALVDITGVAAIPTSGFPWYLNASATYVKA